MAKKKAPQRLPGAEESCISPEQLAIIQWYKTVKFRKKLLGGVDEAAMWKKLEELYALYEAAIRAERTRYNVLLETSPSKPDGFATSPSRGGKTGAAQPEASGTGEPGDVNLAPLLGELSPQVTERFSPDAGKRSETERFSPGEPATPKEAHSDAPAGQ